jgi:hypothetical protein
MKPPAHLYRFAARRAATAQGSAGNESGFVALGQE